MIKHVGKHDQKKAVLLFKEVPGEDDMCLIVYTDTLPALIHDPMMKCIESEVGQTSNDITGPLSRTLMDNGQNVLTTIHSNGYIRKVPTNQFIVTPNANTTIRLDELNKILKQMDEGEDAKQKMAELDAQSGLRDPGKSATKEVPVRAPAPAPVQAPSDGVLTDANIAQGQLNQAEALANDAQRLLSEAEILRQEAYTLAPELKPAVKTKATRKAATPKAKAKAKRKPGRPRKNAVASTKS